MLASYIMYNIKIVMRICTFVYTTVVLSVAIVGIRTTVIRSWQFQFCSYYDLDQSQARWLLLVRFVH